MTSKVFMIGSLEKKTLSKLGVEPMLPNLVKDESEANTKTNCCLVAKSFRLYISTFEMEKTHKCSKLVDDY